MTHLTCRLTAKNRDQLRNPTLGNRVWATFTFLGSMYIIIIIDIIHIGRLHWKVGKIAITARRYRRYHGPDVGPSV